MSASMVLPGKNPLIFWKRNGHISTLCRNIPLTSPPSPRSGHPLSSVPAEYTGALLTLKIYPDRLYVYQQDNLIVRYHRSYDRHQDIEDPDHPKALLVQRKKARDQKMFMRFLSLFQNAAPAISGPRPGACSSRNSKNTPNPPF